MPRQDRSQLPLPTQEQVERIHDSAHRVQSGIAFFEGRKEAFGERHAATEPKHLRVGVNSALVETSAIAAILFRKGVVTAEEYYDAISEAWEREVDRYRTLVKQIDPRFDI